ncbi:helix-turn-helix domain-containing protein [Gracilibacillus marinus]|uniref:Helix-turn-helix domain-containing protein n=1 Tax=Gracilibacillus marinus TaxID=630535 RepID=A0ABV8VYM6_9BACI
MCNGLIVGSNSSSVQDIFQMINWKSLHISVQCTTENGKHIVRILKQKNISFVLINLSSYEEEGFEICKILRNNSTIPILLLCGNNDFSNYRKALSLQVNDYLPEPLQPNELKTSIQQIKNKWIQDTIPIRKNTFISINKSSSDIIQEVKNYVDSILEESINKRITLKEIAAIMNYNCSYLGQKFKEHEKITFNEYLLKKRMEKAKHLLENTDMKVYEVANEVGYMELDWFYKKFKLYTGVNANKYRELAMSK